MSKLALSILSSCVVTVAACGGTPEPVAPPVPSAAPSASAAPVASAQPKAATSATAATPPPPEKPAPTPLFRVTGFATPESVLHDEAQDRYLVSNIQGRPVEVDNNGFISEVTTDGKVKTLKWIEGGKNKVTLNAPKGLVIVKDVLYVTDLDTVRMFDVKTGAPKGDVKIEGATFLNDIAAGADGKIYASDSGLKMEGADFKPTGTDAVWVIEKGKAKPLAKTADLGKPNGLLVDGKSVWVTTFGTGELYKLDEKGQKSDVTKLPKGMLDGIVMAGDSLLVSSWEGSAIFKGKAGKFEPVLEQLKAPADIGWDKKRSRVLVPRFMEDAVEVYEVK